MGAGPQIVPSSLDGINPISDQSDPTGEIDLERTIVNYAAHGRSEPKTEVLRLQSLQVQHTAHRGCQLRCGKKKLPLVRTAERFNAHMSELRAKPLSVGYTY